MYTHRYTYERVPLAAMDGFGGHYAKWNKSDKGTYIICKCMISLIYGI